MAQVIQADYMRTILDHIETAGLPGQPTLESKCPLCWKALDISTNVGDLIREECSLPPDQIAKSKEEFYSKHFLERTVFLHCGHLFGRDCYEELLAENDPNAERCVLCFKDNKCGGCTNRLYDASFDPVAWPLDPAQFNPYQEFYSKVTLTGIERDPDVKRFCERCALWQIRRKFAQMFLMFPRCPGCFLPAPPGIPLPSASPGTHDPWRQANVDNCWMHPKIRDISRLIWPSAADIRDPQRATLFEADMVNRRNAVVTTLLADPNIAKLRGAIFKPCTQDSAPLAPDSRGVRLEPADTSALINLAWQHSQAFWDMVRTNLPVAWYRGDEAFRLCEPAFELNPYGQRPVGQNITGWVVNDNDRQRVAYRNLMMLIGKNNTLEAVTAFNRVMVNPLFMALLQVLANDGWPSMP
ncbi:hypothetical protein PG993_011372 [Apiospora rasikravindrae]|uniref:RING-type domain-containing protein n=1 Tax=Apiospora rasikravindrae TaxID=990691 RepID=A0ABR1SE09_9PEZI